MKEKYIDLYNITKSRGFKIGKYTISHYHDGDFWLANEIGEGTQISKKDLEDLIDKFFNKYF